MKLIIVGPPGSGKGTHARKLAAKLSIPHISTGELFREISSQDTEEGRRIKYLIDSGNFISDDVTYKVLRQRLDKQDAKNGFILDGFPRTVNQAEMLEEITEIDKIIYLNVSDEECIRRLAHRTQCRSCKAVYGNENKPETPGTCDACGGELYVREDEKEDVIKKRLVIYHEQTEPILDFYMEGGQLIEIKVEGIQQPEDVFRDICNSLGLG